MSQRDNAAIQAWKETSEISQDPCDWGGTGGVGGVEELLGHLRDTSTFQCRYKDGRSHNRNRRSNGPRSPHTAALSACPFVTDLGCRHFPPPTDCAEITLPLGKEYLGLKSNCKADWLEPVFI